MQAGRTSLFDLTIAGLIGDMPPVIEPFWSNQSISVF
jgi:hypothetical protein